jgi:hypothetical protein
MPPAVFLAPGNCIGRNNCCKQICFAATDGDVGNVFP